MLSALPVHSSALRRNPGRIYKISQATAPSNRNSRIRINTGKTRTRQLARVRAKVMARAIKMARVIGMARAIKMAKVIGMVVPVAAGVKQVVGIHM